MISIVRYRVQRDGFPDMSDNAHSQWDVGPTKEMGSRYRKWEKVYNRINQFVHHACDIVIPTNTLVQFSCTIAQLN